MSRYKTIPFVVLYIYQPLDANLTFVIVYIIFVVEYM